VNDWKTKLVSKLPESMREDPKKAAALAGLGIVFAAVMIKQFAFGSSASTAAATQGVPAAAVPLVSLASPSGISSASESRQRSDSPVAVWIAEPIKTLERNLFEFKGEFYPRSAESVATSVRVIEDELFWDQLAKSLSARADSKKQRQIRVDNLQQAAGKLKVQSTIMGPNPRAMVDGRMTRLGGLVEADAGGGSTVTFKVIKVEARRLVIERDGLKFEVPMGSGKARVLGDEE
jgi:hypothetical protein